MKEKNKIWLILLTIIKIVLIVFVLLESLFWFLMFISGHQIPRETSDTFMIYIGSYLSLLIILIFISRLIKRKLK